MFPRLALALPCLGAARRLHSFPTRRSSDLHLTCRQVVDIVNEHRPAVVAIDSPRSYAPDGQTARDSELQLARAICGIRWTPDARRVHASAYYAWILEGLDLFDALANRDADV